MSSGFFALITVTTPLLLFFIWRIRIARKINKEENKFIEQNIGQHAILIFHGNFFEVKNKFSQVESFAKIQNLYGTYTFAISEGEYNTVATFEFPYGNGSKLGRRCNTPRMQKTLSLKQGLVYRYRLENDPINKKDKYKKIFEEIVISRPTDVKVDYSNTIIFEEKIND